MRVYFVSAMLRMNIRKKKSRNHSQVRRLLSFVQHLFGVCRIELVCRYGLLCFVWLPLMVAHATEIRSLYWFLHNHNHHVRCQAKNRNNKKKDSTTQPTSSKKKKDSDQNNNKIGACLCHSNHLGVQRLTTLPIIHFLFSSSSFFMNYSGHKFFIYNFAQRPPKNTIFRV